VGKTPETLATAEDHRNAGANTKRPGTPLPSPLGRTGGHILPHVGQNALTNPRLMRRDQNTPTFDPPAGPDRVL
jgi:hypothetical protein